LLPPDKPVRVPKIRKVRKKREPKTKQKKASFLESYLSDLEKRASSGNGLAALAILGLPQPTAEQTATTPIIEKETDPRRELITLKAMGTVKDLPKNIRRLPRNETNYLKNLLKHLGGYHVMNGLDTGYAKFSAIKAGRYGDEYYFSKGTNPWDNILNITVDPSLSNSFLLPTKENHRAYGCSHCDNCARRNKPPKHKESILDSVNCKGAIICLRLQEPHRY